MLNGTVRLFPEAVTAPPLPERVHWLFETVLVVPGVTGPKTPLLLSLNKYS